MPYLLRVCEKLACDMLCLRLLVLRFGFADNGESLLVVDPENVFVFQVQNRSASALPSADMSTLCECV